MVIVLSYERSLFGRGKWDGTDQCDLNLEHASLPIPNWNTGSVMYHNSMVGLILMILVSVKDS